MKNLRRLQIVSTVKLLRTRLSIAARFAGLILPANIRRSSSCQPSSFTRARQPCRLKRTIPGLDNQSFCARPLSASMRQQPTLRSLQKPDLRQPWREGFGSLSCVLPFPPSLDDPRSDWPAPPPCADGGSLATMLKWLPGELRVRRGFCEPASQGRDLVKGVDKVQPDAASPKAVRTGVDRGCARWPAPAASYGRPSRGRSRQPLVRC